MPFEISGYVLEPVRIGQSNSPFTQTPDNYISDQVAFSAAYPSDESEPRTDYFVFVFDEGTGLLVDAVFAYSKNEVINRFDYASKDGRYKLLPGNALTVVGTLGPDSNTNRLKVTPPVQVTPWSDAPYRLSVGTGSGDDFIISLVGNDAAFGSPVPGTVELSMETGNLNWNTTDLVTYLGQSVRFQQQQFFDYSKSTGNIGHAPILPTDSVILLNPKPGTGQYPLLRFGYGFYLQTTEVPDDSGLTPEPASGYVKWSLTTGRLAFNSTDATNNAGIPVYYDGVVFSRSLTLPSQILGNISTPSAIVGLPPIGVDLIFSVTSPYYQFPQFTYLDSSLFSSGKTGVVQVDPDTGDVNFSDADKVKYAGKSVTVTFGDLPIEHGISIRFLRTPVNLDGSQGVKDVTAIYDVSGAKWASPIIGAPQVYLPSIPIDTTGYPMTLKILQGQGSYVSNNFPRLDVTSPPAGLGYYIDFDTGILYFAQRKNLSVMPIIQRSAAKMLPDPLVLSSNLILETDESGSYQPLILGVDALFDTISGQVSFTTTYGEIIYQGTNASFSGTSFTDSSANFSIAGIQPGDLIEVVTTVAEGIYTVSSVFSPTEIITDVDASSPVTGAQYNIRRGREILADRFFDEVVLVDPSTKVERIRFLGIASNSPQLSIPVAYVDRSRFRFGPAANNYFATPVLVTSFGTPVPGTVEIQETTGLLKFATADLGLDAYWVHELEAKVDYTLSAELGLIQFTDRMLSLEEVLVTYTTSPPSTTPPTPPGPSIQEYARFLIRKEVTEAHPTPTSTLYFNTSGKYVPGVSLPVASTPMPAVYRGGRPQTIGTQCIVNTTASTITFLTDAQITDALPHGSTVNPSERVYIDYYVTQAVGGEKTITVLNPPLLTAAVNISESTNQFTVYGDQTASFPALCLLRIEKEQTYLIGNSSYDTGTNQTTVTLYGNQLFQDTYSDPRVYVSSGSTPITSAPLVPAYFVLELTAYEAIARGSNQFIIAGDRTISYRTGTVLLFTDLGGSFTDFIQVSGSKYDGSKDQTTISLTANALRQYVSGTQQLLYSVRPVYEPPTIEVSTSHIPVLTQPYLVYRRVSGFPGAILSSPIDYSIDDSGKIVFESALLHDEEFAIFYTGYRTIEAGYNLRASYTSRIVPTAQNGLLGQVLTADYYIWSPDTFYYRVETMTNFRGEYAQELVAKTQGSSSGPQTSNVAQQNLYDKGRPSLYFSEKHLTNQDIIGRSSLLFYNTLVNDLEAYLRALDGRVVGNNDGLFLFDGTTGSETPSGVATFPNVVTLRDSNAKFTTALIGRYVKILSGDNQGQIREVVGVPTSIRLTLGLALPSLVSGKYSLLPLNQIDDTIRISPAPYTITFPPFSVTSIGTYQKYYLPGSLSRFYPMVRDFFGVPAITTQTVMGEEVLDTRSKNVTLVSNLHTRLAWGVLTESTDFTGLNHLHVDFASGVEVGFSDQAEAYARPPFKKDMKCVVQRRDGSFINDSSSPVTITNVADYELTITGLAGVADIGTTIYRSPIDDSAQVDPDTLTYYLLSRDYSYNGDTGQVTYIEEIAALSNTPLIAEQSLSGKVNLTNALTAPYKFPALYGGIEDDDGDLSFPIQTPDPDNEQDGHLEIEHQLIHNPTGTIRTVTTEPFIGIGILDPFITTITNVGGAFVPPLPLVHDLVRILDGLNGPSSFVRITSVGANTVTVDTAFAFIDAGFSYEITVSSLAVSGAATFPTPVLLVDLGAVFLTSVRVGYTVIVMSGANNGERRQIVNIIDNNTLELDLPLPFSGVIGNYRVSDSLATYGGAPHDYMTNWSDALTQELSLLTNVEQASILDFFDQVFTDIFTSATGQTNASSNHLHDAFGTFQTSGVTTSHYVFILSGGDAGFYQITSVNSEILLEVSPVFPSTLSGVSYRIVKLFGASKETIDSLFALYQSVGLFALNTAIFQALVTTRIPVVRVSSPDLQSFTRGTLTADLDSRDGVVETRLAVIPTAITTTENILANTDKLYDQRYVWIDARINLESGLIEQQRIAVNSRVKAQEDFYNQLVKLLAVES